MGSWRTGEGRCNEWGRRINSEGLWSIFVSEQVRMRSIWDKYYADAHGVIFVVDAADVARFEEAKLAFCG